MIKELNRLFKTGMSTHNYYKTFNYIYQKYFGRHYMLHYPMHKREKENLFQCQKNLTDYCMAKLPGLSGKRVLEVGCGNGTQLFYITKNYNPEYSLGIDLSPDNIHIARSQKKKANLSSIDFLISDAQEMHQVNDSSMDVIINIESAFHYPDKKRFLSEIYRILKPGGSFLIADIINKKSENTSRNFWNNRMRFYHSSLEHYKTIFTRSSLRLKLIEDITLEILQGYNSCRRWVNRCEEISGKIAVKAWCNLIILFNSYLLKTKRSYYIFAGRKP